MAEGFELYHVPQQCRRGKLRLLAQTQHPNTVESSHSIHNHHQGCEGLLLPLYEPSSLVSSDLLTCAAGNGHGNDHGFQHESSQLLSHIERFKGNPIKEEGMDLMGFLGSASGAQQNAYLESHGSIGIIPTSVHDITYSNHQSSYYGSSQHVRQPDQAFNGGGGGGEIMVYRPETLSLSLPSYQNQHVDHPLELNLQRYVVSSVGDLSASLVPLGPFTGYASILKGSRFSKPARQLLEDSCDVSSRVCFAEKVTPDLSTFNPSGDSLNEVEYGDSSSNANNDDGEHKKIKSRLISMLDEVYKRYKQYYQQLEAVIVSFESVAGLSNAVPFVNLALKAMSKQFRRLKKAIIDQLQLICKSPGNLSSKRDEIQVSESRSRPNFCGQLQIHNSGNHPVWRPQRGLPQRAVSVLRSWLFEHFLHPYPTDADKVMLAKQTGLTRGQVSNWFINARVRLWKPMVEEIHALEAGQSEKTSLRQDKEAAAHQPNDAVACASELTSDNVSFSCTKTQDASLKRVRTELPDLPLTSDQQMSLLPYNNLPDHACMGVGAAAGGSSGVSLTLGLHHNTGIGLPDPFPTNLTQRYDFNANSEGCIMGVFDGQTRRDVMGGHLLHDFVG